MKTWLSDSESRFLLLLDGLNEVRPEFHEKARSQSGLSMHQLGAITADLDEVLKWEISDGAHPAERLLGAAKQCRLLKSDGQQPEEPNVEFLHPCSWSTSRPSGCSRGWRPEKASTLF
jgi:hypothetical protein